jgi:hypothetical protein
MSKHKFKVGQNVYFQSGKIGMPAPSSRYKIVRQLPHEGGERTYRIKTDSERFERVARESEITSGSST